MEPTSSTIIAIIVAAVPTLLGFFMARTLRQIDSKLDHLASRDTETQVQLAKIRLRILVLEKHIFGGGSDQE